MHTPLYVAAGGGGDALAAALLHRAYRGGRSPVIASLSWDRLIVDPLPGPRTSRDFTGLETRRGLANVVTTSTRPVPPAGSTLPTLASALTGRLGATLVLLDPAKGVVGLRHQLESHIRAVRADAVIVVDVGGDVLAQGDEPGLRSPLGDALVLAATDGLDVPSVVWVAGPGVDGELPSSYVRDRLTRLDANLLPGLARTDATELALPILRWHPSEGTALLVASALGVTGLIDVRAGGMPVPLDAGSSDVFEVPDDRVLAAGPIALSIRGTRTLAEADAIVSAACGRSEIAFEITKQATRTLRPDTQTIDPNIIVDYLTAAAVDGITYATYRRLAELTGSHNLPALRDFLLNHWPASEVAPLWQLPPIVVNIQPLLGGC